MELWHARYFLAVADALSFRQAAERLQVSQPPVSRAITQLEAELGARLFERSSRHVALTEAGVAFRREAVTLLRQADRAMVAAQRASSATWGRLAVAFEGSAVFPHVPRAIGAFRARFPGADITMAEMPTLNQVQALRAGEIDFGFLVAPIRDRRLTMHEVWREPIVALLPQTHRLASHVAFPLNELAEDAFIISSQHQSCGIQNAVMGHCRVAGFEPHIVLDINHPQLVANFVAAGCGVALAARTAVNQIPEGVVVAAIDPPATAAMVVAHLKTVRPESLPFLDMVMDLVGRRAASADGARPLFRPAVSGHALTSVQTA